MKNLITNITQSLEYLVERIPWVYRFFDNYYENIIDNEIDLAGIKKEDRILCIGGGPCPSTAIQLHMKTGARVCVIDNDEEVVESAIRNVKRFNLCEFVSVELADGTNISAEDFSVVHIALQVSPKTRVFEKVVNTSLPGTKVLVRVAKDNFSKLYSPFKDDFISSDGIAYHRKKNLDYTLMHVTRGGANEEVLASANSFIFDCVST